jgi:tetratricopeptide (TPR) repeat protein
VHWADEATLDVLRLLARRVETVPALVVASYRDDELDRAHPLRIMLGELATSRTVGRMKLVRLSPGAVTQLAEPYGVDADELYRKTAGNPFFVVEALATGAEGIPDTVRDAVLARAARLSPAGATLLEAVAVVPPQAELWLLEALAGDAADRLDECLTSGMLVAEPAGVGFRHELARLAVEESVPPHRKVGLHRRALADPPVGAPDLARLAHHAEAAGDADAVLRFAPAAGARAASLGAYREAAAQYARALRVGDRLSAAQRAELLERRSFACYLTDQNDAAVDATKEALECRRQLGQRLEEGDSLRWLSKILWCPGRITESERAAREAVTLLEALPPGRELAMAYANLASTSSAAARSEEAVRWAGRALELAERLEDTEITVHTLATIGTCEFSEGEGEARAEPRARAASRARRACRASVHRARRNGGRGPPLGPRDPPPAGGARLLQRSRSGARSALPARLPRAHGARPGPLGGGKRLRRGRPSHPLHLDHAPHLRARGARARPGAARRPGPVGAARRGVGNGGADRGAAATGAGAPASATRSRPTSRSRTCSS